MTNAEKKQANLLWFKDISINDILLVGEKNASLGEMYNNLTKDGITIPNGFAITAQAYWTFLEETGLRKQIKSIISNLDVKNIKQLTGTGKKIRNMIMAESLPKEIELEIINAYKKLSKSNKGFAVAVRSGVTAENLPTANFAGQQETYLNVRGEKALILSVKKCIASLFTNQAISYREGKGVGHLHVALSVTVQEMVKSDTGASGVMFTVDKESGFNKVVLINASYGLGEYIVNGRVTPDQYYVFKPGIQKNKNAVISRKLGTKEVKLIYGKNGGTKQARVKQTDRNNFAISDEDVVMLAKWGMSIEQHYGKAQDIEWAKDGKTGKLYILQARLETIVSQQLYPVVERYFLKKKGKEITRGISVGQRIGAGKVRIIDQPSQIKQFKKGDILVTRITNSDWEPIMRMAAAIITEQGGKTGHAAIMSRELGVPCIVGVKDARKLLKNEKKVTVSCAAGEDGVIYREILPFEVKTTEIKNVPETKTKIMMNIADPDNAFSLSHLPHDGIGLARLEFIFTNFIKIHPLALLNYKKLKNKKEKAIIAKLTLGYKNKADYCIDRLAEGIARIAASSYDRQVIVRLSDFKTNEYANLIGGEQFEPKEANPTIGWRGASRYYSDEYKGAFELECKAIKKVRDNWGLDNVVVMVPFCRTPEEGKKVLEAMKLHGLERGKNGLQVYVMCEIPSNVVLAEEFADIFDGFSIGTNDLTQMTLGLDRETGNLMHIGDVNNRAVKKLIKDVIKTAHTHKKKIGICGQAPSDYPEFAEFLVQLGIDSISLNPDTVVDTKQRISALEKTLGRKGKKTHKSFVSLVAVLGVIGAAVITLGAGCQAEKIIQPQTTEGYVAPALIREKVEARVKEEAAKQRNAEMSHLQVIDFASFSLSYPTGWKVEQWNGGITLRETPQHTSSSYVSIYKQLVAPPINLDQLIAVTVSGKQGTRADVSYQNTDINNYIIQLPLGDNKGTIVIEGRGSEFDTIVNSIQFNDSNLSITDRPLTHWDQREGRICAQVITYAQPKSGLGSCIAFPTPCDVPADWDVCDSANVIQ